MNDCSQKQQRTSLNAMWLPILLASLLMASCQKKLQQTYQATDGMLRFEVSDTAQWQEAQTARSESQLGADSSLRPGTTKVNGTVEEGRQMYLVASVKKGIDATNSAFGKSSEVATKGTMITGNDAATFHQSFGILAQSYSGTAPAEFTPNFMDRVQVSRPANGDTYSAANKYYIPTGQTVKMFAYAPYDATTLAESHTGNSTADGGLQIAAQSGGRPSYNFRTPKWIGDQDDLCFAETSVTNENANAQLNFQHAMAAVKFLVSTSVSDCKIESISISNVKSTATLTPGADSWWTNQADPVEFTYNNGEKGIPHTSGGGEATPVFGANNAMFMIPQDLEGVTVTISVTDANHQQPVELSTTLSDDHWGRGNTYTYTLSFSMAGDVHLEVTPPSNTTVTETGGDFTFSVTSERDGSFVPYKIQYQSGDNWQDLDPYDASTMISSESQSGTGTTRTHTLTTVEVFTINSDNSNALRAIKTETGTSQSPSGLANGNTANCYIVKAPGWYSLPLVFGNGLINGTKNGNSNLWTRYTDAYGNTITDPWIKNSGHTPTSARVLWQDVEGLVRDVQLYNTDYLKFHINTESIYEGNAVVGCFDASGVCLWSWHIWVTPSVGTISASRNSNLGGSGTFMAIPLGYVQGGTATWAPASITIRFIPEDPDNPGSYLEGSASESYVLSKSGNSIETPGRYPTYQWGRKDPMRPLTISSTGNSTDCPVYPGPNGDRSYLPTNAIINGGVTEWIKNPHKFHNNTTGGIVRRAFLWDASQTSNTTNTSTRGTTGKSLYDPCPYGYSVPPSGSFDDLAAEIGSWGAAYLVPEPSTSTNSGGYGTGYTSLDLTNTTYGSGFGYGYAIFNVYSIWNNPATTTWRIPLLGGRAVAKNFENTMYGDHAFYWMTGKPQDGTANCLGIYLPAHGTYTPWIDLIGLSNYTDFTIGDVRNSYAVLPYDGAAQK